LQANSLSQPQGAAMDQSSAGNSGATAEVKWVLRLLGPFGLTAPDSDEPAPLRGKRERALLAYLAVSPNFRASRRKLAALLWGDTDDDTTLDNLRVCIWRLRKGLGQHQIIASQGEDIVLDARSVEVDVLKFRRLATESEPDGLEAAANLYGGEFLESLSLHSEDFESWRRTEATRCRDQMLDVLSRLMTQCAERGGSAHAIETGMRILRIEPLHEPAVCRLMRLYEASGRRAPAVELYRTLAGSLKSELGVQPQPETRAVFAEITSVRDAAAGGSRPAPVAPPQAVAASPLVQTDLVQEVVPTPQSAAETTKRVWPVKLRRSYGLIAAGAVAAGILIVAIYQFAPATPAQTFQPAAQATTSTTASANSIAVLPFANLSGDPNQEFFSDGMTEEVTTALAKIPYLRVVARASAFQYKNPARNVQNIGRKLHVTYLIEGSVRKDGDRVRIAVQLINAGDGNHVWAEEYDRPLVDIFATQEDIARMIAASLRKPLGLQPGENLVNNRPADTATYDEFLRAKALWWQQNAVSLQQATTILEKVVVRIPNYAPAWSLLADAYLDVPIQNPALFSGEVDQWHAEMGAAIQKGGTAARRALERDPKDTLAWRALARIELVQNHYPQADELNARALAIDPDDPNLLLNKNQLLHDRGYLKQALAMSQRAALLEPNGARYKTRMAWDLWLNGRSDEVLKILEPQGKDTFVARIYAEQGRYGEAADILLSNKGEERYERNTLEAAARLLRNGPAKPSSESMPKLGQLYWVYFFAGAPEHMLDWNEQLQKIGYWAPVYPLWAPRYASIRKTERFKNYIRSLGFVDYWRQHGWPDLCRPLGTDDFACN
jgi:TolB-like protein/DNA-binding SARP family transcriptional activator